MSYLTCLMQTRKSRVMLTLAIANDPNLIVCDGEFFINFRLPHRTSSHRFLNKREWISIRRRYYNVFCG
jgi:hypothetical protein